MISDVRDLYFRRLVDDGKAVFEVEDSSGRVFEISLVERGPYLVSDEEHLTKYWAVLRGDIGRTFIVEDSRFAGLFPGVMDPDGYTHYVISTYDVCLEVLAKGPPKVESRDQ